MRMDDSYLELRFLKCVIENDTAVSVASLDETLFTHSATVKLFHKAKTLLDAGRDLVDWESLCSSVHLDDAEKDWIRDTIERVGDIGTEDDLDYAYEQLLEYWKYRMLQEAANRINEITGGSQPEDGTVDGMLRELDQQLENIRGADTGVEVWHLGEDCPETTELIERAINPTEEDFLETGFEGFDSVSRGIPATGVLMIAANTGVGKTAMAANLCYRWKMMGLRSLIVPLEMDATEMTRRWVSAIAGVELMRITKVGEQGLTSAEKDMLYEGIMSWFEDTAENGGDFMLWSPKRKDGITLQEILYGARREKPDVIVIDQASLIDNNTSDPEWQHISGMMKVCKRFAWVNRIPIVWLQQLDKDLELRYVKRTEDDADVSWFLEMVDEETGLMKVIVHKQRAAIKKDFWVDFNRTYMLFDDAEADAEERKPAKSATAVRKQRRSDAEGGDAAEQPKTVNRGHDWMKTL